MKRIVIAVFLLTFLILAACAPAGVGGGGDPGDLATEVIVQQTLLAPTETPAPPTETPLPTATPYVYGTASYLDSVPTASPQQFYLERGNVAEYASWVFVLLGSDSMSHRQEDHTDTFIIALVEFPPNAPSFVSLVSVARDTYVYLPGFGNTRINNVWALAGEAGISQVLRYNFGLDLDGYIYSRTDAVRLYIDNVLDGVTVNVPEPVFDECGDLEVNFSAGPHDMDGTMAMCYARVRARSSDYPRMLRQQSLLLGMRDKGLQIAGSDPLGFLRSSLEFATHLKIATSTNLLDVMGYLFKGGGIPDDFHQYRLMPPFSVHFDHPVTGAWLLAPPTGECMAWLMDQATLGEPWLDANGAPLAGPCQ